MTLALCVFSGDNQGEGPIAVVMASDLTATDTWPMPCALQRQNAENLKQIFPEKKYRGLFGT